LISCNWLSVLGDRDLEPGRGRNTESFICNKEKQMIKVKICGITNHEDASEAARLGADAVGFIFAPSPRQIVPELARDIILDLPPFVQAVGVFVNEELSTIRHKVAYCGLDMVQLHGDEPPDFCRELMPRIIKAFRLKGKSSLSPLNAYRGRVKALLLDTYEEGLKGGTGKTFDWSLAVEAEKFEIPIILSGGLGPSNIETAISTVKPYAIDVNSTIEARPGKKNLGLMRELMEKVNKIRRGLSDD
jgi:phosphoribosylanthranilate isomerase